MGRSRYKFQQSNQPHFITCTVIDWLPIFADERFAQIIIESLSFIQSSHRLTLYAYVIMRDHLHLIVSSERDLSEEIRHFKSFTARQIIDALKGSNARSILAQLRVNKLRHKKDSEYQIWQEGSHPELIQGYEMMREKIQYIHANPVRAGLVENPIDWPYSSAGTYEGRKGILDVVTEW